MLWLTAASLFFYAWWRPINVLLIAPSILINLGLARLHGATIARHGPTLARALLIAGIVFNLCFLGYFKYTECSLRGAVNDVFGTDLVLTHIDPAAGYLLHHLPEDRLSRRCARRARDRRSRFRDYALFVLFFPQLIAGPIVHYREMMPQFRAIPDAVRRTKMPRSG